jgi:uncharacterized protein
MTNDEERVVATSDGLSIVDVPGRRRFEVRAGEQVIGHTRYARSDGSISLVHTEVDPSQEGKGVGSVLVSNVLADVTARGLNVVVRCPFIGAYVRRHQGEYPGVELRD